jgi:sec-independent protein translocase protein TatA
MFGRPPGWPEIILILVVVMIVFGVGKLPQVGGAIGKSLRAFQKAQKGEDAEEEEEDETPKPKSTSVRKAKKTS